MLLLQMGEWQGALSGLVLGSTNFVVFASHGLAVWYGARQVAAGNLDGGAVMSTITACVLGAMDLGQVRAAAAGVVSTKQSTLQVYCALPAVHWGAY